MEQAPAPIVNQNDGRADQAKHVDAKDPIPQAFEVEENEVINPKNEHAWTKEAADAGQQVYNVTPNATSPGEFPLFRKLPTEIRLEIWHAALPGPRLVDVEFHFKDEGRFGTLPTHCTSRSTPPVILGVCHEAREEALKKYSLCFGLHGGPAMIYFDLKADTFFIACNDSIDLLTSLHVATTFTLDAFSALRHLCLVRGPEMRDVSLRDIIWLLEDLRCLETFSLVLHEDHDWCTALAGMVLRELESAEEPEGCRETFDSVMDESPWAGNAKGKPPPVFKIMAMSETAAL